PGHHAAHPFPTRRSSDLDPHTGELGDVEEASIPARLRIPVEDLRAKALVDPERILLRDRHVVRDDVEDDAKAGRARYGAEPPKLDRKSTRLNSSHEWISY